MTIEEKVIEIVAEQMGVSKGTINRDTNFVNDLGALSLDAVDLVCEFQDEYDIEIPDEAAAEFHTVGQVVAYLEEHVRQIPPV